ncbi:hypothetical protein OIV83_000628 [Microbotryomycetes sp. JL201]|nr:hypothetical protein OIV83_000628 [Microbotryomycetes sp. JL201]
MSSWMYSSSTKRGRQSLSPPLAAQRDAEAIVDAATRLHVVHAHEAALIRGHDRLVSQTERHDVPNTRLVQWTGSLPGDERPVWLDKYDALNLLQNLPLPQAPPSPVLSDGFSDLASDSEELFYFDEATRQEIAQGKKRRRLEIGREHRMRELAKQQESHSAEVQEASEARVSSGFLKHAIRLLLCLQPSQKQLTMMQKLHATLSSSAEPALLEMRIMANYASDPRFSFLRKNGQFRAEWEEIRAGKLAAVTTESEAAQSTLVGYGSDSDNGSDKVGKDLVAGLDAGGDDISHHKSLIARNTEGDFQSSDLSRQKQEQRARKAKAWAERRRAEREPPQQDV